MASSPSGLVSLRDERRPRGTGTGTGRGKDCPEFQIHIIVPVLAKRTPSFVSVLFYSGA